MKRLIHAILIGCAGIPGCNALGGIQPDMINAVASAGGGCIAVENMVMGKGIVQVAGADKGALKNGTVSVAGGCAGITISNVATPAK